MNLINNTFKKLALSKDEAQATNGPDLLVTETKNFFQDNSGSTGQLEVHRNNGNFTFPNPESQATNSNASGAAAVRFSGDTGDTVATTWDDGGANAGTPFYYFKVSNDSFNRISTGMTAPANYNGIMAFPELASSPFASIVPVTVGGQVNPTILFTYSQKPNTMSILSGATAATVTLRAGSPIVMNQAGLMQPYAGDADNDGTDELGVYTSAVNNTPITGHVAFYSYKNANLNMTALVDLPFANRNVRGISLGYLGNAMDRRRQSNRRDLVILLEDLVGKTSSLLVARANLNFAFP